MVHLKNKPWKINKNNSKGDQKELSKEFQSNESITNQHYKLDQIRNKNKNNYINDNQNSILNTYQDPVVQYTSVKNIMILLKTEFKL